MLQVPVLNKVSTPALVIVHTALVLLVKLTASAEVLVASVPKLSMADAQKLVAARASKYFRGTSDANAILNQTTIIFTANEHSVSTSYFEVLGRLRLGPTTVLERSLVQRDGINVRTLWRERAVADPAGQARP